MNEALTQYEMIDIIVSIAGQVDSLFNYWISASFAVVVSSYIARENFTYQITLCVSILYLFASLMFLARAIFMGITLSHYINLASEALPASFEYSIPILAFVRGPTFLIGFLVAQYYLWYSYRESKKVGNADA